ncbi:hypothetical protein CCR75_005057 [Bremia lactucae]|uniref:Uncharacterized protein n=1 Tax=Bremia lactucae TaxID=4779 RepID=A0A976IF79_BRELC|nr:hypothetical protein CCR75_005057 [Bremia lactucae]
MLANVAAAATDAPSSSEFLMDGTTTYCWEVDTSIYSNTVDKSLVNMISAQGNGCPLKLSIAIPTDDVHVYESVNIVWNATERLTSNGSFEENAFGISELAVGLDRISQKYFEIVASRLRTCSDGLECHPVTSGSQLTEHTTNVPLNFTQGLAAFESSELSFDKPGQYTLLAHLILPSTTPELKRYDYAVLLQVRVLLQTSAITPYSETSEAPSSSGLSTVVICVLIISGIVALALVVIGSVTLRSKIDRNPEAIANKRNKSKSNGGVFSFTSTAKKSNGEAAVVSDEDAEEFAMLSMLEATICQKRNSTFLSALTRGRRDSALLRKSESPIQFAGPVCRRSMDCKGVTANDASFAVGDITPQSISIETPSIGRGNYVGIEDTPKVLALKNDLNSGPPGQIMFNDIKEDDLDSTGPQDSAGNRVDGQPNFQDSTMSAVTELNLTAVSVRIKQHRDNAVQDSSAKVKQDVLTADDLRDSVAKGPMALSDLLSSRIR